VARPHPKERSGPGRVLSLLGTAGRAIPEHAGPIRKIGRYALYAEIAAGGLATVHLGRLLGPVGFARIVAIKRLHPQFAKDPEFVASFLDEARLASRVRHPNVVPTLDVVATGGELFVIMEFVLGESLAQLMRLAAERREAVPVHVAVAIMAGVLHGLHAAHEARDDRGEPLGLVHRDVSPHNVLVGADGAPHLIDFGIAKARGRSQVTRDGQIKGKLSYMPPEQLLGETMDRRADIFAASIVLWEMLTGRRLFQGVDDGDVFARVLHAPIDRPSAHARDVSPALDSAILLGLARDKASRYATAREMALDLEAAAALAPPSRVGNWVESLAHVALGERGAQVVAIEQDASSQGATRAESAIHTAPATVLVPVSSRAVVSTSSGWGEGPGRGTMGAWQRPGRALLALLSAVIVTITLVAVITWRGRRTTPNDVPSQIPATSQAQPIDPAPLPPAPSATALATLPMLPSVNATSESRPVRIRRPSPQTPAPARVGGSVRPTPSIAPSAVSCDPPFWYDSEGNKRYYRQCVGL
jgi:eukaryotic-like serine/threonine-protein kinase